MFSLAWARSKLLHGKKTQRKQKTPTLWDLHLKEPPFVTKTSKSHFPPAKQAYLSVQMETESFKMLVFGHLRMVGRLEALQLNADSFGCCSPSSASLACKVSASSGAQRKGSAGRAPIPRFTPANIGEPRRGWLTRTRFKAKFPHPKSLLLIQVDYALSGHLRSRQFQNPTAV